MCYDYIFNIFWILSIPFSAMSTTNSTTTTIPTSTKLTSTSPEALPIVWRTSTTQLPLLPTYLVPPPLPQPTRNSKLPNRTTTKDILHIYSNHNYDGDVYINHSKDKSQQTQKQQLVEDINNLGDLYYNLQRNSSEEFIQRNKSDISDKDQSRLKSYSDSFPLLGSNNMSLGSFGNAGNDSGEFGYEGTLMAFANNPFGNGRMLGKKNKKVDGKRSKQCYNSKKKCYSTSTSSIPHITPSAHSNNLLDAGQHLPSKPTDVYNPLYQPTNSDSSTESRYKRGVIHLYNMVSCATGCNPLIYKGYGCYCGFLGSGYAVDGIDRCCKFHDWCYDTAKCPMYLEYFIPYYWKCYRRRPVCAIEHGEWGGAGSCAQRLCECDRVLSECLSRYPCPSTRAICTSSPWRLLQNAFMIL